MPPDRVFIAADVIEILRSIGSGEKQRIARLFEQLADNPFRTGDYTERDEVGRPIQVVLIGRYAVYFWANHADREIKILDLRKAGS